MGFLQGGAFRLFRVAGIDVFLHWSWILIAVYVIESGQNDAREIALAAAVYVTTFAIVLLHEFGHAFACRSVGGLAEQIILWPLGGIAFSMPPPRAGAVLWTIAAGPLVNVALLPVTWGAVAIAGHFGLQQTHAGAFDYLSYVAQVNTALLLFNLLPVYPLDGGQIVQSLLWFAVGRANSLRIAGSIGMAIGALVAVASLLLGELFLMVMALFVTLQAWNGIRQGNFIRELEALPRREGLHCPSCHESPVVGEFWSCPRCRQAFDIFERNGFCPHCGHRAKQAICPHCGRVGPLGGQAEPEVEAQLA